MKPVLLAKYLFSPPTYCFQFHSIEGYLPYHITIIPLQLPLNLLQLQHRNSPSYRRNEPAPFGQYCLSFQVYFP